MNRYIAVAFLLCFFVKCSFGQTNSRPTNTKEVCFQFSPKDKNVVINGCSLGWEIHPWSTWADTFYVKLNGLNLEVGPFGLIEAIYGTTFSLFSKDEEGHRMGLLSKYCYPDSPNYVRYGTQVNGVSLSIFGLTDTHNNGFVVNGLSCFSQKSTGLLISGLINVVYEFKGVSLAGFWNIERIGHGLQIGLFNNCQSGKLVQIGIVNRIGNRVTPFINFSFRNTKQR